MRAIWLVIKHDVAVSLRKRSFWVLSLLLPLLLLGMNAFNFLRSSEREGDSGTQLAAPAAATAIGFLDRSGLVSRIPVSIPSGLLVAFADEAAARAALDLGAIAQYVVIPSDYLQTGEVQVYDRNFQVLRGSQAADVGLEGSSQWMLDLLLTENLTGDPLLAGVLRNPTPGSLAQVHITRPAEQSGANDEGLARLVLSILPMIYYVLLLTGSSYLMQSVVAEKESRTVEVLLLSINPRQLMVGKLLAGSVVLAIQLVIWMGGGVLALNRGAALLEAASFAFPPGFVLWASLLLLLGYLLYASIMAAVGALAPTAREGNQAVFILVIPFMPVLMLSQMFLEQPQHPLVVGLSLFPFSAPAAMVTRLAVGPVPVVQILLSLALLALTTGLFVLLAARFFKAGNLLSEAAFTWKRLAAGWRHE